jgi:hypothetical protein
VCVCVCLGCVCVCVCVCHCLGVRRRGGAGENYNRSHIAVACVHSVLALVGSLHFSHARSNRGACGWVEGG